MVSLGRAHILASSGIERQLHPGGDTELVVNIAQVVPNRVFGNAHLLTELARAHALRQKVHDFRFAWRKKTHAATGLDNSEWFELREEPEEKDEILVAGPDLPAVHRSNALGQQLERGNAVEDTSCTASKGVDDQFSVCLDRVIRNTDDTDVLPSTRQLNCQQVSAHEVSIGDDDPHSPIGKL